MGFLSVKLTSTKKQSWWKKKKGSFCSFVRKSRFCKGHSLFPLFHGNDYTYQKTKDIFLSAEGFSSALQVIAQDVTYFPYLSACTYFLQYFPKNWSFKVIEVFWPSGSQALGPQLLPPVRAPRTPDSSPGPRALLGLGPPAPPAWGVQASRHKSA